MTLIELIVFIVVVSVGLAGVMSVLNLTVMRSADPLVAKQAMAVADALLEEITLKNFCDPTPAVAVVGNIATGSAAITGIAPGTAGILAGWKVAGAGAPAGATVVTVDSPTQVTLSATAAETRANAALRFMPCAVSVEALRADFDDIRDYNNATYQDATDVSGTALFSPANTYQTKVEVTQPSLAGTPGTGVAAGDVFRVVVTVKGLDGQEFSVTGYRYNYD